MQVGEQHLPLAQSVILGGDGFLDLEQQIRLGPHFVGGGEDLCAGGLEVFVGERRPDTRTGLDHDLVATLDEFVHPGGADRDAVLVVLDLGGNSDLHDIS